MEKPPDVAASRLGDTKSLHNRYVHAAGTRNTGVASRFTTAQPFGASTGKLAHGPPIRHAPRRTNGNRDKD